MGDYHLRPAHESQRHRRAHALELPVPRRAAHDGAVGPADSPAQLASHLVVGQIVQALATMRFPHKIRMNGFQRQAAGFFSGERAAHTIGDKRQDDALPRP